MSALHVTLANVYPKRKEFSIFLGDRAAEVRPKLAVKVAKLFALGAELEFCQLVIATELLSAHAGAAAKMFTAMRSARSAALKALIASETSKHEAALVLRAVDHSKAFDTVRNKFAHCCWIAVEECPKYLGVQDSKNQAEQWVESVESRSFSRPPKTLQVINKESHRRDIKFRQSIELYDSAALDKAALIAQQAIRMLTTVSYAHVGPQEMRTQEYLELERLLQNPEP